MFKSRLDENLKADEIYNDENEDLCYEIVKHQEEKPLTLQEARQLVEQNYLLNKRELTEKFDDLFGTRSDILLSQYLSTNTGDADDIVAYNPSEGDDSTEDEMPKYIGRGYGLLGVSVPIEDMDEELLLDESDEVSSTISINRRANRDQHIPMTNYGKGPPPSWSNVFANSSSDED